MVGWVRRTHPWRLGQIHDRTARPVALVLFVVASLSIAATLTVWAYARERTVAEGALTGLTMALGLAFCGTGALLVARVPANPIGWILYVIGIFQIWNSLSGVYAVAALDTHPGSLHLRPLANWASAWSWMPSVFLLATFLLLLFPDGHPPAPRWRWVGWIAVLGFALALGGMMADTWPHRGDVHALAEGNFEASLTVAGIGLLLTGLAVVGSVVSLIVRFRRSTGDERQQLRWFTFAAVFMVITLFIGSSGDTLWIFGIGFCSIPIATAVSILKYRLYDLDLVINKTIVYVTIAVLFTGVYVAIVVGIGSLLGAQGISPVLAIAATAIVAVAFHPARERAQRFANRLVYGRRATPYEVLWGFADRLADAYSIDDVLPRMARLVADGTGASAVTVWLTIGAGLRPAASWPVGTPSRHPVRQLDEIGPNAFEVRHQGATLGAIGLELSGGSALSPEQRRLVMNVASQAGLVLRNVRLIEDLRESRRRIVAAQDERAKKLERDIHDGAQQQLVALAVKERLAASMIGNDDDRARALLDELRTDTESALENLRDLARGIYPPLLADAGLAEALGAHARKSSVPVAVQADLVGRFSPEVEAAVYFICLEAPQNVAKYADASRVAVRLSNGEGELRFEVIDDGRGFDPRSAPRGSGLQGRADRIDAVGGRLSIASEPGAGTRVAGSIPVSSEGGS